MTGRSYPRTVRRDLRRAGCTCHARIEVLPRATAERNGATAGALIRHEIGCDLGDRIAVANEIGLLPSIVPRVTRCDR